MPTNANVFNSRVTSEALEKKFRDTFPAQGGAELIQDLFASGVIVPTVDFTSAAQGSELQSSLQQAWDFSTGSQQTENTTSTLISNTGFWRIQGTATLQTGAVTGVFARIFLDDGATTKNIWAIADESTENVTPNTVQYDFIVFLRAGDSLKQQTNAANSVIDSFWRQVADVNGNLVNPLGFSFS